MPLGLIGEMLGHATPQFTWAQYVTVSEAELPNLDWQDKLDASPSVLSNACLAGEIPVNQAVV